MIWGYTGTRNGMTRHQLQGLVEFVDPGDTIHVGCCVGGDQQACALLRAIGVHVTGHPCVLYGQEGHPLRCTDPACPGDLREAKEPRARNEDIVAASEALLAAPRGTQEELRSGTWQTIRIARKQGVRIEILVP